MIDERSLVIVYLNSPREKYWGRLQGIGVAGVYLRGMDLNFAEEWARELARGEEATMGPSEMFVPLSRVEKIFLDEDVGAASSVASAFKRIVGRSAEEFL